MELMSSEIEILIIEDEHIIALGLRKLLLDLSFKNITIINTAKEGIEYIRKSLPEIVFLDMNLHGELQGIDVLKFIEFHWCFAFQPLAQFQKTCLLAQRYQ